MSAKTSFFSANYSRAQSTQPNSDSASPRMRSASFRYAPDHYSSLKWNNLGSQICSWTPETCNPEHNDHLSSFPTSTFDPNVLEKTRGTICCTGATRVPCTWDSGYIYVYIYIYIYLYILSLYIYIYILPGQLPMPYESGQDKCCIRV